MKIKQLVFKWAFSPIHNSLCSYFEMFKSLLDKLHTELKKKIFKYICMIRMWPMAAAMRTYRTTEKLTRETWSTF